jgi:hypothetical protein
MMMPDMAYLFLGTLFGIGLAKLHSWYETEAGRRSVEEKASEYTYWLMEVGDFVFSFRADLPATGMIEIDSRHPTIAAYQVSSKEELAELLRKDLRDRQLVCQHELENGRLRLEELRLVIGNQKFAYRPQTLPDNRIVSPYNSDYKKERPELLDIAKMKPSRPNFTYTDPLRFKDSTISALRRWPKLMVYEIKQGRLVRV